MLALGGEPSFSALRELLGQVKQGTLPPDAFAQAALSDLFFGADGNGDAAQVDELRPRAETGTGTETETETVIQQLVRTLPDAQVELRDQLLQALSERLAAGTVKSGSSPAAQEQEQVDAELADDAALPASTTTTTTTSTPPPTAAAAAATKRKKKAKRKQKKSGRQVAEGRAG